MSIEEIEKKLYPCLHCGNIPDVIKNTNPDDSDYGLFHLSCWCGIEVNYDFAEKVIETWNRRDIDNNTKEKHADTYSLLVDNISIEEWGDKTGLKLILETHRDYGNDIVRLALISFREYLKDNFI